MKTLASAVGVLLLCTSPALATLGRSVDSVENDRKMLEGTVEKVTLPYYSIHQITRGAMTVKEYVSPQGTVFGVSWRGPTMPNLQQLLGDYFQNFQQSVQSRRRRTHEPVAIQTGDLVVESGGHMRAFHGRAYVNSLVPNTVTHEVVQ